MKRDYIFGVLAAVFCCCLIVSNIFETVIFSAGPLTLTGGFLIFPISYIINDCLSELYGYRSTRAVDAGAGFVLGKHPHHSSMDAGAGFVLGKHPMRAQKRLICTSGDQNSRLRKCPRGWE